MALLIDIAQQAEDLYKQSYDTDEDFFTPQDFILYCGNELADIYQTIWTDKYKELRSEKKDEVVSFDTNILATQTITVPSNLTAKVNFELPLQSPIMSFAYDQNNCGLQAVFYSKDNCNDFSERAVRSTLLQKQALKNTVICDRLFYYADGLNLGLVNRRFLPVNEVLVYYVPAINENMIVPDGLINIVINGNQIRKGVVRSMKEAAAGVVIKNNLGDNSNQVLESNLDLKQVK